jgi:hypothetical protein
MMKKRGASHVDWAISMGMFVIYILSMFIIVQPGVQKVFKEDNMMQIAEEGLDLNTGFYLEKTPFTISFESEPKDLKDGEANIRILKAGETVPLDFGNTDNYWLFDKDGNSLPLELSIGSGNDDINFMYTFSKEEMEVGHETEFVFYYLENGGFDKEDRPKYDSKWGHNVNSETLDLVFGLTEIIEGNSEEQFFELCGGKPTDKIAYEAFKDSIGFPESKEFRIYYVKAKVPGESVPVIYNYEDDRIPVCEAVEPYDQADIFVKEYITSFMDNFGEKFQARVNIRIW